MKVIQKKEYVNPSMEVVKLKAPQLLAGSPTVEGEYSSGNPIYSRQYDYED